MTSEIDRPVAEMIVARARELARSHLEGIENAARELVGLAGGDGEAITEAYRVTKAAAEADPSVEVKQAAVIVRRAIEVGMEGWDFDQTAPP